MRALRCGLSGLVVALGLLGGTCCPQRLGLTRAGCAPKRPYTLACTSCRGWVAAAVCFGCCLAGPLLGTFAGLSAAAFGPLHLSMGMNVPILSRRRHCAEHELV